MGGNETEMILYWLIKASEKILNVIRNNYINGFLKACDEVCGKVKGTMGIHGGGMKR